MKKSRVADWPDRFRSFCVVGFFTLLFVSACVLASSAASTEPRAKNVLMLFGAVERYADHWVLIESALRHRVPGQINFYHAYLEDSQIEEKSYRESQAETFRRAYAAMTLDLVIATNPEELQFAAEYRDKIFPGVPIVFTGVSTKALEGRKMLPGVTGLTVPVGLRETIDLALHLHPGTKAVAIITSASSEDQYWLAATHAALLRNQDKVRVIDIVGPASGYTLERVAALPPDTVVLFHLAPGNSTRPSFGPLDLLAAVAQRLPTYSPWRSLCLNYGCIGGAYEDVPKEILWTGEIAARVLQGERPENIPVAHNTNLQMTVDWRALQRWHIPVSALPRGTAVLYRKPSLWQLYWKYIVVAILVILVQSLLIIGLLEQRARKRKAEAVLRESEQRFRLVANTAPVLIWLSDSDKLCTYFNKSWLEFTGRSLESELGNGWKAGVHPEDLQKYLETYTRCFDGREPFRMRYRLRRHDGQYRWMLDTGVPRFRPDSSFAGYIGSAIDVTERKLAEEALSTVSRRLIEAQEQERIRIARELHDDISQQLALLSIEIARAESTSKRLPAVTKECLGEIRRHCSEVANDVHSLSHQLHSSKLDLLGMVAAIRGFCNEFAKQHDVTIEFNNESVPGDLPKDVSLCLFRIAQEALHNALKYSGTTQFWVELVPTGDEVQLIVRDAGAGFDVEKAKRNSGLGLVSMEERVNLVHGRLSVESRPGEGTRVVASVPAC